MRIKFKILKIFFFITVSTINISFCQNDPLTPQQAIQQMTRGINIGNTMDPEIEGTWGNPPVREVAFDDYKAAGFTSIRIPITWNKHTSPSSPYTIDKAWLDRVEQVVDWGLNRKLIIIINAHHEGWIKEAYTPENTARFDSIWSQIATRFKDKSDSLLFEIINEPKGLTQAQIDELNPRILSIIRKTNPTRIVIFSGNEWSNSTELLKAKVPDLNDKFLMGYYHSYDPYPFGLEGPGTYGSASDISVTKAKFDQVKNWSETNNIPVILGEFGAQKKCEYNSRMIYHATVVDEAIKHNIAFFVWDDGGDFGIYDRNTRGWNDIKDILIYTYPESPNQFKYSFLNSGLVKLSWENRTTENDSIIIDRGSFYSSDLASIAKVAPQATEFIDSTVSTGSYYFYRLRTTTPGKSLYSYPLKTTNVTVKEIVTNIGNPVNNSISLYPNPVTDKKMQLKNIPAKGKVKVKIYNMNGKLLKTFNVSANKPTIDLKELPEGVYSFVISTNKTTETTQIVIQ